MGDSFSTHVSLDALTAAFRPLYRALPDLATVTNPRALLIYLQATAANLSLAWSDYSGCSALITVPAQGDVFQTHLQAPALNKALNKVKSGTARLTLQRSKRKGTSLSLYAPDERAVVVDDREAPPELEAPKKTTPAGVVRYPGAVLLDALPYLMRATTIDDVPKPPRNGLMILEDKIAVTDGHRIHVQAGMPMAPFQGIVPERVTGVLYGAILRFKPSEVTVRQFRHGRGQGRSWEINFVGTQLGGVVTLRGPVEEIPALLPSIMPPIETAFGLVFDGPELDKVLEQLVTAKKGDIEILLHKDGWFYYYLRDQVQDTCGCGLPSAPAFGSLQLTNGDLGVWTNFDPKKLRDVLATLGNRIQIITYPEADPETCRAQRLSNPYCFNGNSNPLRWGLLMPKR